MYVDVHKMDGQSNQMVDMTQSQKYDSARIHVADEYDPNFTGILRRFAIQYPGQVAKFALDVSEGVYTIPQTILEGIKNIAWNNDDAEDMLYWLKNGHAVTIVQSGTRENPHGWYTIKKVKE